MTFRLAACCIALWTTAASASDPAAIRAELDSTLGAMSRAVLEADAAGFLAHIARDEPFLAMEWKHWADQLKAHKPAEFVLSAGDGPAVFEAERAEFPMVMRWRIEGGPKESWGAGGETRSIVFPPVVFAKEDPDGAGPESPRWLYKGEKWTEIKGDGFVVRYQPGELAENVAKDVLEAFPVARAHDNEGFGVEPPPQILKLYTSMDHLKATVYLNMPDHVLGGWSEPDESIKFMITYTSGVKNWINAYAHEYGHVCTWTLGPHAAKLPWWVTEGAAELAAQEFRPNYWAGLDKQMRTRAEKGTLAPWSEISDYITTKPMLKGLAYTQGHHMVGFISDRVGREGRNAWLRAMCQGATLDEATRQVLKMPFEQLDREWRASLAAPGDDPGEAKKDAPAAPPAQGAP